MSRYNRMNPDEPIRHDWTTDASRIVPSPCPRWPESEYETDCDCKPTTEREDDDDQTK